MAIDKPPAIIAGAIGSTSSLVRSLGRAGVPVIVLNPGLRCLAQFSRYCREVVDVGADAGVVDRWLAWLLEHGPHGAVVLPSGDEGVELIARHREALETAGYRLPETSGEVSLAMLDKGRTYELAARGDIPCPRTWAIDGPDDLHPVLAQASYPCALKPVHSHLFAKHFATKVLLAADGRELREAVQQTSRHGLRMLVTEIIPGPDSATWSYSTHVDADGRPLYELTRQKLRSYPIHFGTNCLVVTRRNEEVAAMGRRFLTATGLRGMAHVEFKADERDGSLRLIECNHRFVAVTELLRRAGLDVALFAYLRACGAPTPPMDAWREGTRLWFPERDLLAARDYRAAGELTWKRWLGSLAHRRTYTPHFAWDDPGPSFAHWSPKIGRAVGRLWPGAQPPPA